MEAWWPFSSSLYATIFVELRFRNIENQKQPQGRYPYHRGIIITRNRMTASIYFNHHEIYYRLCMICAILYRGWWQGKFLLMQAKSKFWTPRNHFTLHRVVKLPYLHLIVNDGRRGWMIVRLPQGSDGSALGPLWWNKMNLLWLWLLTILAASSHLIFA